MALQFSFEYCIDPKVQKSEEEYKAIAADLRVPSGHKL